MWQSSAISKIWPPRMPMGVLRRAEGDPRRVAVQNEGINDGSRSGLAAPGKEDDEIRSARIADEMLRDLEMQAFAGLHGPGCHVGGTRTRAGLGQGEGAQ